MVSPVSWPGRLRWIPIGKPTTPLRLTTTAIRPLPCVVAVQHLLLRSMRGESGCTLGHRGGRPVQDGRPRPDVDAGEPVRAGCPDADPVCHCAVQPSMLGSSNNQVYGSTNAGSTWDLLYDLGSSANQMIVHLTDPATVMRRPTTACRTLTAARRGRLSTPGVDVVPSDGCEHGLRVRPRAATGALCLPSIR